MKTKLKIILVFFLAVFSSCDSDFGDINDNPFDPTNVASGAIFNDVVSSLRLGWSRQLFLQNEILYDLTEQAVVTAQTFGNITGGTEELWSDYYNALKNAKELYSRFDSTEDPELSDVIKAQVDIIMAYKTFQITDLFGDIPYSEAGSAFANAEVLRPVYDDQENIYKSLIDQLDEASQTLLNAGQTSMGNNHLRFGAFETLFNDNLSLWIRFSNSLQLRHLVRMYEKDPEFVEPRVKSLIENGADIITSGNEAVMSPREQLWLNQGVNWSFREHNKIRMGTTVWNFLTDENEEIIDPRARFFFETNINDEWAAFPQIPDSNTPQSGGDPYQKDRRDSDYFNKGDGNIYASVNFYLVRDELDIPEILISAAELRYLRAEIFMRGIGVSQDPFLAKSEYEFGMIESLEYWQDLVINSEIWINKPNILTTGELFNTVLHPKYAIDLNDDLDLNLEKIYAQRWLDLFRQPAEAFALLRRTNATPREKPDNNFFRFKYPPSEFALNAENYLNQVAQMGSDETNVKIWWMP